MSDHDTYEVGPGDQQIQTMVGNELRRVDYHLFLCVHDELADKYRAQGLTGRALDEAIVAERPAVLAIALALGAP